MADQVQVIGGARLAATLAAAAAQLDHLDGATTATSRQVAQRAGGRAPKRSGRLASSLRPSHTGSEAVVGSGVVYAGVQHYGWPARNIRAHPFLVPVAEASSTWRPFYVADVNRVLTTVKGA
jgi:phage gpG-like protein